MAITLEVNMWQPQKGHTDREQTLWGGMIWA